ncbi:MAG: PQQ-binding-like beta-propeller repeat protein [Zavarzinella sp.]
MTWKYITLPTLLFSILATALLCLETHFTPGSKPLIAAPSLPPRSNTDYYMFGGSPSRNFVNTLEHNLSTEFPVDPEDPSQHIIGDRLVRKLKLGNRAYGGPTIAAGRIYVGTNNENPRNDRDRKARFPCDEPVPLDKGILMCFDEKSGDFLWQAVHDKLELSTIFSDWPKVGIVSTPVVRDNRVYYVSNRCELMCVDAKGLTNGNDGMKKEQYSTKIDADVIWKLDLIAELKVFPHSISSCSPLIVGDLIYVVTSNGVDEAHISLPAPEAPSFIAVNKWTGKIVWQSNLPGINIMHGQWSNPAYGEINNVPQVVFPGGDGWLYSFEPLTGKLLWKFDANPKDAVWQNGGKGTKSYFIGTPVIYNQHVYIGVGQDPEHFEGVGYFWCIDASKRGDISKDLLISGKGAEVKTKPNPNSGAVWVYGGFTPEKFGLRDYEFGRTISTACIIDDIVYIAELAGYVHCLDAKTGKCYWHFDTRSLIWGSCYYVDGKILVANEDGVLYFFKHLKSPKNYHMRAITHQAGTNAYEKAIGNEKAKVTAANLEIRTKSRELYQKIKHDLLVQRIEFEEAIRGTPIVANGLLYIQTEEHLYVIKK